MTTTTTRANLQNIQRALECTKPITVKHHLGDSLRIDDAKLLGFGTKAKVMVRFYRSNGWTVIDPLTWEIL